MFGLASGLSVSGGVLHNLSVDRRLLIVPWPLYYHLPHSTSRIVQLQTTHQTVLKYVGISINSTMAFVRSTVPVVVLEMATMEN